MIEHEAIDWIFSKIGVTNRFCIEFGVQDGLDEITTPLINQGWSGLYIERLSNRYHSMVNRLKGYPITCVHSEVTAENINGIFKGANIPDEPDFLSIDIDGMDYWIWKAITYRPRVLFIEYNATKPPGELAVVAYDPHFVWKDDRWFGASLSSLAKLGKEKGYELVGTHHAGITAYFVRNDLFPLMGIADNSVEALYHKAAYGNGPDGGHVGADGPYLEI